ncbi:MAG TPA: hypothetical protein VK150_08085, partial [Geothrix sp.]|nr:hypothetical protein [Geothrix sp.]
MGYIASIVALPEYRMKVLKSFLLGATAGLVLAVALAVGAYVSPLRETLYLDFDPEIAALRERL